MADPKDEWKIISVWVIAVLLVSGTVICSGIFMMRIETTARYEEPFVIEFTDERSFGEWETIRTFPHESEMGDIDLTLRTYHEYIKITYEGRRPLNLTTTFAAQRSDGSECNYLGFVLLEGIIDPENITWNGNEVNYDYGEQEGEIQWGTYEEGIEIEKDEENYTLINVLRNDAPICEDGHEPRIFWNIERTEVGVSMIDESPPPGIEVYNLTPFILIASGILTVAVGYTLFKDIEVLD